MATDKDKLGFKAQWVDGTPVGQHVDSDGDAVAIDIAFLEAVVKNFNKTKTCISLPRLSAIRKLTRRRTATSLSCA